MFHFDGDPEEEDMLLEAAPDKSAKAKKRKAAPDATPDDEIAEEVAVTEERSERVEIMLLPFREGDRRWAISRDEGELGAWLVDPAEVEKERFVGRDRLESSPAAAPLGELMRDVYNAKGQHAIQQALYRRGIFSYKALAEASNRSQITSAIQTALRLDVTLFQTRARAKLE